jgi:hypothetical protein
MSLAQLQRLLDQHPSPTPTTTAAHEPRMTMGHIRKALGLPAGYVAEKRELAARTRAAAKNKPTPTTKPKTPTRAAALAKALTTPRTKPLTGDDMLLHAERLLHAGKLDPATAQRIVTSVHLGRVAEAADLLKNACK